MPESSAMVMQNEMNPAEINARRQFYFLRKKLSDVLTQANPPKVTPRVRGELVHFLNKLEGMTNVSNYNKTDQSILNDAVVQTRAFIVDLEKNRRSELLKIMKTADIYNMLYPKIYPRILPRIGLAFALLAIASLMVLPILFPTIWMAVGALIATLIVFGVWSHVDAYLAKPSFNRHADTHPLERETLLLNEQLAEEALNIEVPTRKYPGILSNLLTKEKKHWQPAFLDTFSALYGPGSVLSPMLDDSDSDDENEDDEENTNDVDSHVAESAVSKPVEPSDAATVVAETPTTTVIPDQEEQVEDNADDEVAPSTGCVVL